ncbi:MAG: DUF1592 domain-containing protein [Verrucomicrobiota bacterium]
MKAIFGHFWVFLVGIASAGETVPTGEAIYAEYCASCHGKDGEGVEDEVDEPLQGDRSPVSLARYIDRRMPEDEPELLDAEQSKRVADFIYGKFYSAEARAAHSPPPKPAFARLTNRQFRESIADLLGSFGQAHPLGEGIGLKGQYFQSDGMNKKARKGFERTDTRMDFNFGEGSPGEGINAEQFSIGWDGSLLAAETGWHEFRITTPNGARLYLNGDRQDGDGNHRDDSGAKRQDALIDAWVSSGGEERASTARIFLLAGRAYPLRFDFFKYKEQRAMVRLEWKTPRSPWQVLATPALSPAPAERVTVVNTPFPADDASEGYERGTGISKDWHEATTAAAVDVANEVIARLPRLSGVKEDAPNRGAALQEFVATFAQRAFRRPLDDGLRDRFVSRPFGGGLPAEQCVKRAIIQILTSPRFLYPDALATKDDPTVASRLALAMWDSLPDQELREAAAAGKLHTRDEVAAQARRMSTDPRARAKMDEFFRRWLKLDVDGELTKSHEAFPSFDDALVADLRTSLELFVRRVVDGQKSNYRELLTADYLWLNQRLADFYGVPMPDGGGFQPVKLDPAMRAGVLTHPYLLAQLAHHDITSPIQRGVFLTRNILGSVLKPPPEAIAFENHKFDPSLTMREKVAELTRNPSCMTCHETINPLGFSLENFDPVGRYRTHEGDKPINPRSDFITREGDLIHLAGPRDVAAYAVDSATARRGFIRQFFQYAIKQNPAAYGHETIAKLDSAFVGDGENVRNLLAAQAVLAALHEIPAPDQASNEKPNP